MKTVVVASENPVKVAVAQKAFAAVFPEEEFSFVSLKSESGVGDQPFNEETEQGGLFEDGEALYNRAWIMVCDQNGFVTKSSTPLFYLPTEVVKLVRGGMELAHAADEFFGSVNLGQGVGAVGFLTDGIIDRENYYLQAAIIAVSQLKHKDWY